MRVPCHKDHSRDRNKGVGLLELVMYIGIFAMMSSFIMSGILSMADSFNRARTERTINEQGTFAVERILRAIRLGYDIDSAGSVFNVHPGALKLVTAASETNAATTTRRFSISGGNLVVQDGASPVQPLTSHVSVVSLVFRTLAPVSTSTQAVYYVRKSGSDSNNGLTPATAFASITKSASSAGAGSIVYVGSGTYNESGINPLSSGTTASTTVFIADISGAYTTDAPGAVVIRPVLSTDSGIRIAGKSFLEFNGFTIIGGTLGVYIKSNGAVRSHDIVLRNMAVHTSASSHGMQVSNSDTVLLVNNLVYNNNNAGITIKNGIGITIRNSTVYKNGGYGIRIEEDQTLAPSSNVSVINNILFSNTSGVVKVAAGSAVGYINTNNVTSDPLFLDPDGADNVLGANNGTDDDFHIQQIAAGQSSNSLALDEGSGTAAGLGLDTGTTRTDSVMDAAVVDAGYHYYPGGYDNRPQIITTVQSKSIRVELTLETGYGRRRTRRTFYGSAVLRNSY